MSDNAPPKPVFNSLPRVVTIVGRAGTAFTETENSLQTLAEQFSHMLDIRTLDVDSPVIPNPDFARLHESTAIVLVVDPRVLNNPLFQRIARSGMEMVATRDDFRLFMDMSGIDRPAYSEAAGYGHPLLAELVELVQIGENTDRAAMLKDLAAFLQRVDRIAAIAAWRETRRMGSIGLGWAAAAVQLAVAVPLLGTTAFLRINGLDSWNWPNTSPWLEALAIGQGLVSVPLLTVPLYLLGLGFLESTIRINSDRRTLVLLFVGAIIVPWASWLPAELDVDLAWVFLGFAAGIVIDAWRREGVQARRTRSELGISSVTPAGDPVPEQIQRSFEGVSSNPLTCPLVPANMRRVAISYSRGSAWSRDFALKLHDQLKQSELQPFIDCRDIPIGDNWRRRLAREITGSDVFICVLDDQAMLRHWVAAELEAALFSRHDAGLPMVIVLVRHLPPSTGGLARPAIFERVLDALGDRDAVDGIRVIKVEENTLRNLASQIKPWITSGTAVLPDLVSIPIKFLLIPFLFIGALGSMAGTVAGILWAVEEWQGAPIATTLTEIGLLPWACVLLAYMSGFTMRLTMASMYEIDHEARTVLAALNGIGALGLVALLAIWHPTISELFHGWAIVAGVLGWFFASALLAGGTASSRSKRSESA